MTSDKVGWYLYYMKSCVLNQLGILYQKIKPAKEAEHPLQDAPTLTDSQDISGGSCSPSSGIPAG